jgi:hypothetical protein
MEWRRMVVFGGMLLFLKGNKFPAYCTGIPQPPQPFLEEAAMLPQRLAESIKPASGERAQPDCSCMRTNYSFVPSSRRSRRIEACDGRCLPCAYS